MIGTLLVTGGLLAVLLAAAWPVLGDWRKHSDGRPGKDAPERGPASLEGLLVSGLIEHEVTPAQYRRAMEHVALRDDERFPLRVPPGAGRRDQGLC